MEKTIIIYYLIGLLVAYFAVGISNKITKEPLTSWFILLSWLSVLGFCYLILCWVIYKILELIYYLSSKFLKFLQHIQYNKFFIGLFSFIKKIPLVFKWVFNIFKKLHFVLIPPEKGIDLIINLFKNIWEWLSLCWVEVLIIIFTVLLVVGFYLLIFSIFFGVYIIVFSLISLISIVVGILIDNDF